MSTFSKVVLSAPIPLKINLIENPKTLGEKLRNRRLEKRLLQKELADILQVSEDTITNWELNRTNPDIQFIPTIIKFLGYIPFELKKETLSDRVISFRLLNGMSQERLANILGVNESTIYHYEKGDHKPSKKVAKKLYELLKPLAQFL